jgi:opacity protein-like surface antigen
MSSGTLEPYLSFMAGVALPRSTDATFTDGTTPTVVEKVDYAMDKSIGGSFGIWFPTRKKLAGFDLGVELTGYLWYPDVGCCRDFFNNDSTGTKNSQGFANNGTTTEMQGLYIGPNFLIRYPMAISEAYPNGRWHPYVGIGVGMHQMSFRPGGSHGVNSCCVDGGNLTTNPITDQRDTTVGFQGVGGVKVHLFKYVAAFAEAKYLHAHHNGLGTDRFGSSDFQQFPAVGANGQLILNTYSSSVNTILVHAGLSIHFDWKP